MSLQPFIDFWLIQVRFVDRDMLMRFTGQGIGHKNTYSRTSTFRDDLTTAYGSWVAELEPEVGVEEVEQDSDDSDSKASDEGYNDDDSDSEVEPQRDDDSDWEDGLSDEDEENEEMGFDFDENGDILGEEEEYGYTPL